MDKKQLWFIVPLVVSLLLNAWLASERTSAEDVKEVVKENTRAIRTLEREVSGLATMVRYHMRGDDH